MSKYSIKTARRGHSRGQAIIEMALVLPLMLIMIVNFIAIMVLVVYQQKLEAGANIAATSVLTAPLGEGNAVLPCPVPQSILTGTIYQCAFAGTFQAPSYVVTTTGNVQGVNLVNGIGCSGNYFTGTVTYDTTQGVTCIGQAKLDFKKTALGFGVFWSPTITVKVLVFPSPVRQCTTVVSGNLMSC